MEETTRRFDRSKGSYSSGVDQIFFIALGWSELGAAPGGPFAVAETILIVLQIVFAPIFLFMQVILLFLPMLIASAFFFSDSSMPSFNYFWKSFWSSASYWQDAVGSIPW